MKIVIYTTIKIRSILHRGNVNNSVTLCKQLVSLSWCGIRTKTKAKSNSSVYLTQIDPVNNEELSSKLEVAN